MANTFKFGNGEWAVGKETALAYNDENSNFKPLPFTFERASTATVVNKDGLIETVGIDEPRIDFLNDSNGALLLEPARTNLIQQSNKFDTYWTLNNITVASGQIGVGGNSEAWKITASSGSGEKRLNINLAVSGNHAISIYAKKGTKDYLWLRGVTSGANKRVFFNLANGTISQDASVSSNMIDMGNGWYRCEAVFNQQSGFEFFFGIADNYNTPDYTDDGTGTIYVQYAQAEAGSYATSYIPTQGSAVTRSAETCNGAGNSTVFNDSEGVLYAEIFKELNQSTTTAIGFSVSSGRLKIYITSSGKLEVQLTPSSGDSVNFYNNSIDLSIFNKVAFRYNSNGENSLFLNGVKIATTTGVSFSPSTLNSLNFDFGNGSEDFYGNVKDIKVYNTALTDAELIALTS